MLNNSRIALSIILVLVGVGCHVQEQDVPPTIFVAAASDLLKVSVPLKKAFERSYGTKATFSFGASGNLEQQIRHGAPFDLYAPAARGFSQALLQDGFVEGGIKFYALGRLAAWSRNIPVQSLAELKGDGIRRIAIANPAYAPYGLAAQQVLESLGLWSTLQPKLVYADSVAHAFQMAETGNADVALVAISLVSDMQGYSLEIASSLHAPIEQTAVVLKSSRNQVAAKAFLDFLGTAEAQKILREYGFELPQGS